MSFSFSSWFKGKQGGPDEPAAAPENPVPEPSANAPAPGKPLPPAPVPPAGVRQTQPVGRPSIRSAVPNAMQPASLREASPRPPVPLGTRPPTAVPAAPPAKVSPVMPTARKISFGGGGAAAGTPMVTPSFPTLSPSPAAPRATPVEPPPSAPVFTVALTIGDFIERIPPGLLKPGQHPLDEQVEFLSTELYSDLTKGRASVPASVIYEKCPAIFARAISDTEDAEVPLPLPKIVQQMSAALQTRPDQVQEETGAEIETPFLHVANEDNARLPKANGTTVGALPATDAPTAPKTVRTTAPIGGELPASVSRGGMRHTGQISTISPIKTPAETNPPLAPPSAASVGSINPSKRPPSTVRASVAGSKIRVSGPTTPARGIVPAPVQPGVGPGHEGAPANPAPAAGSAASSPSHQVAKKTARIQIPPISLRTAGAGANGPRPPVAFNPPPSVPAPAQQPPSFRGTPSSEPPMPNFRPVPAPDSGASVFRTSPPPAPAPPSTRRVPASFSPSVRPSFPPPAFPAVPPAAAAAPAPVPIPAPAIPSDQKIDLSLAAVLRGLPSSALTVSPSSVADDQRILLPFAPIEAQLSQGRINVPTADFIAALPEAYRGVLAEDSGLEEIPIPLQEVFQNLPANALSIRADQVVEETSHIYPTPFSQKADEDAARLGFVEPVKPAAASVVETPAPAPVEEPPASFAEAEPISLEMPAAPTEASASFHAADAPDLAPPADAAAPHLIDTEEASTETEPEPVFEIPADEPIMSGLPPAGHLFTEEPAPELPPIPAAPFADRAEIEAAGAGHPETPIEMPSLAEPLSPSPAEPVLDHGAQALFDAEAAAALPPLELPVIPSEEPHAETEAETPAAHDETLVEAGVPAFPIPAAVEPAFGTDEISSAALPASPAAASTPSPARPVDARHADSVLQTLFMTEDDMDAKAIVKHINQLPGVNACAIMFGDGLPLAGNFPDGNEKAGFSAMAPPFFKRTLTFTDELKLGGLEACTLYTDHGLLSFFMHGDICLSVRHAGRGFLPGVREKLNIVTRELARIYSSEKPASLSPQL